MNKCTKLTNFFVSAIVRNFSQFALDFNIPLAITVSKIEMIFFDDRKSSHSTQSILLEIKPKSYTKINFRVD